jgi:hypothetical protein
MHGSPLYLRWHAMIQRTTTNPSSAHFHNYGGRGITVCDRWRLFENFAADMGESFSPELELDRIDVNGNYEPDNCRWATRKQQQLNRRNNHHITWDGQTRTLQEWADALGIKANTILTRIQRGWALNRVMSKNPAPMPRTVRPATPRKRDLVRADRKTEKRISREDLLARIAEMYQSGLTTMQIGEQIGRDDSTISRALKELGVKARGNLDYLPPIDLEQIRTWHAQGVRAAQMQRRLGVGRPRIDAALDELGLPRFSSGRPDLVRIPHPRPKPADDSGWRRVEAEFIPASREDSDEHPF